MASYQSKDQLLLRYCLVLFLVKHFDNITLHDLEVLAGLNDRSLFWRNIARVYPQNFIKQGQELLYDLIVFRLLCGDLTIVAFDNKSRLIRFSAGVYGQ